MKTGLEEHHRRHAKLQGEYEEFVATNALNLALADAARLSIDDSAIAMAERTAAGLRDEILTTKAMIENSRSLDTGIDPLAPRAKSVEDQSLEWLRGKNAAGVQP